MAWEQTKAMREQFDINKMLKNIFRKTERSDERIAVGDVVVLKTLRGRTGVIAPSWNISVPKIPEKKVNVNPYMLPMLCRKTEKSCNEDIVKKILTVNWADLKFYFYNFCVIFKNSFRFSHCDLGWIKPTWIASWLICQALKTHSHESWWMLQVLLNPFWARQKNECLCGLSCSF